jgi:hypothetical protein
MNEIVDDGIIEYIASSPPDYHYNYSGSALPFANPLQAFEGTPNKGVIQLLENSFTLKLQYPNSYYVGLGTALVPPSVTLRYKCNGNEKVNIIKIAEAVPYRLLTYQRSETYNRNSPLFYYGTDQLPIRTQEQILRGGGYPSKNITPEDHWGLKPRC